MSLAAGLSALDSSSLEFLSSIIKDGQIFTSTNPLDWSGSAVLHLEAQSSWSPSFECFLLDRGLALDLSSPCRSPSKVVSCCLRMSMPCWSIVSGTQFVCRADLSVEDASLVAQVEIPSLVCPCGFHDIKLPLTFVHMYAGAFCGWHQAQEWLSSNHHIPFAEQTIGVEKDFTTASFGATSIDAVFINQGDSLTAFERSVMVRCDIAETRWMNCLKTGANLMVTKSFPCQPFSKGGSKGGLNNSDGRSIVEAILKCRWLQPIGIALENVDDFKIHAHRPIIFELLKWAGYTCKWQTIHDLASIAPAHRRRWLAVFIRRDLISSDLPYFQVASQNILPWNHDMYQFSLPKPLVEQLKLDAILMNQYGDPRMMPPSRRLQDMNVITSVEVLEMRCPSPRVNLATLVSSYSTQHVLPRKHLLWKGIFAELKQTKSGFWFMSPAMWTSLLGNTCELRLPKQLGSVFQFLGNSIALPHAAMGLMVMTSLLDLQMSSLRIDEVVLELWNDRLTAFNAMFIQDGDGFLIVKPSTLIQSATLVRHHQILHPNHDSTWVFVWPDETQSVIQNFGPMMADQVLLAIGFPENVVSCWALMGYDNHGIFSGAKIINLPKATFGFCFVPDLLKEFPSSHTEVEPTQEWTQIPDSQSCPKCTLECTLPDNTVRMVKCEPNQTIEELCECLDFCPATLSVTAFFRDPLRGEPFVVSKQKCVQDVANCSLVLARRTSTLKRSADHLQSGLNECCLEVATLTNQTRIIKCDPGDSILIALHKAGFPKEIPETLVPLNNGIMIDFSTVVSDLPSKDIRLTAAPLRGGAHDFLWVDGEISKASPKLASCSSKKNSICGLISEQGDDLIRVVVTLPDDSCHDLELLPVRTVEECYQIITGLSLPSDVEAWSQHQKLDPDLLLGSIPDQSVCFRPSRKRKEQTKPGSLRLEIVTLDGTTRFLTSKASGTIRDALCDAGFHDSLIRSLTPSVGSKLLSLDTLVEEVGDLQIRLRAFPLKGGVKKQANQEKVDPLQKQDPWAQSSRAAIASGVKWDQLKLSANHPWFEKGKDRLKQVPFQQIGSQVGGIAFATKIQLRDLNNTSPPSTTVVLLPGLKEVPNSELSQLGHALPVQQVVVNEPDSKKQYKRMVLPVVIKGDVEFKMEATASTVSLDKASFAELVLEIHSSLASPQTLQQLKEHPLEHFRRLIANLHWPMEEVSVYAYRKIKALGDATIHQSLMKVHETHRQDLLKISGKHELFVRQYIHDDEITDHSLLARYYPHTFDDARAARQLGESLEGGFVGLALTSKGLAIRALNNSLANARDIVLQGDVRFNEINKHVVCQHIFLAQGFPFHASHSNVIEGIHKATKNAPVPLRNFRLAGVLTWVIGLNSTPTVMLFDIKIGDQTFEILLSKQESSNKVRQPRKNKKGVFNTPAPQSSWTLTKPSVPPAQAIANNNDKRIISLEAKVASLESKQDKLASQQEDLTQKVDGRFDEISDQLRKVLIAVGGGRPRENSETGFSPPAKHHKS